MSEQKEPHTSNADDEGGMPDPSHRASPLPGALLGLALFAAIAASLSWAWNNPTQAGRYDVKQAYSLLNGEQYREAAALLERILLRYRDPETHLALSFAYLAERDADRAERQVRLALASPRPDMQPAAWTQLGRVMQLEGHSKEALDAWSRAVQAASPYRGVPRIEADVRSALWHAAMLHRAGGEWAAARQELQTLIAGDDAYGASARVRLAQLLGPDDPAQAAQLLANLPNTGKATPTPIYAPGTTFSASSVPNLRVPGLQEGLSPSTITSLASDLHATLAVVGLHNGNGAKDATFYSQWAAAYIREGEPALAQRYAQLALNMAPNDASAHTDLGLALLGRGDLKGAGEQLKLAVQLGGAAGLDMPLPHHALAQIYTQQGQWQAAQQEFDTLSKLEPRSVELQLELAEFYRLRGEYGKAEDAYIQATRLQPSGASPNGIDAQLALARFYIDVRGEGCEHGLEPAQASLAAHPGNPDSLDAVGWALMLCGRPQDALISLERAATLAPDIPQYRYHLARAYTQLGRTPDAREQYARLLDLDPNGAWSRLAITDLSRLP